MVISRTRIVEINIQVVSPLSGTGAAATASAAASAAGAASWANAGKAASAINGAAARRVFTYFISFPLILRNTWPEHRPFHVLMRCTANGRLKPSLPEV